MPITKPTLPARAGYVEVTDENGNRVYKPTKETEEKLQMQAKMQAMPEPEIVIDTEQYLLDLDFRLSIMELLGGVTNDL